MTLSLTLTLPKGLEVACLSVRSCNPYVMISISHMYISLCLLQQQSPVEQRYKELLVLRDEYLRKLEELSTSPPSSSLNSPAPPGPGPTTQQFTHLHTPF